MSRLIMNSAVVPPNSKRVSWTVFLLATLMLAGNCRETLAQTTPRIDSIFPPGARRGSELEIQVKGDFAPDDVRLDVRGNGLSIERTAEKHRYRIRVAPEAELGPRELRWVATQGASSPFPFLVGDLPEIVREAAEVAEPTPLPLKTTVNGRLASSGAIAQFSWECAAGQTLVCAVQTRAIRSVLEPVLRLIDDQGKVVAEGQSARAADKVLWFRAVRSGKYTLQVFDFQLNGGEAFVYRLMATDGPWLDYVQPSVSPAGKESHVVVHGWNLAPSETTVSVAIPPRHVGKYELVVPQAVNRLSVPVVEGNVVPETEPNDSLEQAEEVAWPVHIAGELTEKNDEGDRDCFAFAAKKGQVCLIDVDAAEWRSPADIVLSVFDSMGKKLVELDDFEGGRDPTIRFTAPADGRYVFMVRERSGSGGAEYSYAVRVGLPEPDVKAQVQGTSFYLEGEKPAQIPVKVQRLEGFAADLEVTVVDLPSGVEATSEKVPEKTPATINVKLTGTGMPQVSASLARVVVIGKGENAFEREAEISDAPTPTLTTNRAWIARGPAIPFALKTTTTILEAPRLAAFPFPVLVERQMGFTGSIRLVGVEPDRRGTVVPLAGEIPADADSGAIPLVIQHRVTEGTTHRCRVMGIVDVMAADGKSYQLFHVAPGAMSMGCEPSWLTLVATTEKTTWRPGETVEVQVRMDFRIPLGPVTLRIEPPAGTTGVVSEPVMIPADQRDGRLTITFKPDARLSPRAVFMIKAESMRGALPVFGEATFRMDRE